MRDLLTEKLEEIVEPLFLIANEMSNEVVGIIADRLKNCGELLPSDITRLKNVMRTSDLKKIEKAIAELTGKAEKEIERIFEESAKLNDDMAKEMYDFSGKKQLPHKDNDYLNKLVKAAVKNATEDFLALSQTTTAGLYVNNKFLPLKKAYNMAIDTAVFKIQQGTTDYTTAIRGVVKNMAQNGLVVEYESGYRRRLDSAVRMNVLDGVRQMNLEYRDQQGREFGADAYEISAHINCRPDHQSSQGRVFTFEEFKKLNEVLPTPIATGEMNCKHARLPVIKAINKPTYTDKELKDMQEQANEKVTFTSLNGNKKTLSRYECTQYLRSLEVKVRDMGSVVNALKRTGDAVGQKSAQREKNNLVREYHRICKETGIPARINRLQTMT